MKNDGILFKDLKESPIKHLEVESSEMRGVKGGIAAVSMPRMQTIPLGITTDNEKLNTLVKEAHQPLVKISSVFPFDFFPDTIVISPNKVDIISRIFFASQQMYSVLIKNIIDVTVSNNPVFATLSFKLVGFEANPPATKYLIKSQAQRARRVIMGLATCDKEGIDLTTLKDQKLVNKMEEIGRALEE